MNSLRVGVRWQFLCVVGLGIALGVPSQAAVMFTCDASTFANAIANHGAPASVCNDLNTSFASIYSSVFTNANASVFIQYGNTGLGSSTSGFLNTFSYSAYRAALISHSSGDAVDTAATASLLPGEPSEFAGAQIQLTSALAGALGFSNLNGTTAGGALCAIGSAGCYNGIITVTNNFNLYYESGPQSTYDYYSVVSHELNEILGTPSCIDTNNNALTNACAGAAAAIDLFRYQASGIRVYVSQNPGAYFSYNGGVTNVATFNTLANGNDYADFVTNCAHVQDATGCPGQILTIKNDGGAEITMLDALGYNLVAVPEPAAAAPLAGAVLAALVYIRRKRSV